MGKGRKARRRRNARSRARVLLVAAATVVLGPALVPTGGSAGVGVPGPALLQADALDAAHVELAWTPVPGASQYTVYRDGGAISSGATLRTTDSTIAPGTSHGYSVTATVAGVETSTSPLRTVSVAVVADAQAPRAPSGLHTTSVGSTSATLAWSPSSDDVAVIGYFVKVGPVLYAFSEGSTSLKVPYLKASTTYAFDLTALDASGKQSAPASISVITTAASGTDTTPPAAPSLTATPYSDSAVDLSWSKPSDADLTGFLVYQGSRLLEDIPPNSSAQTRVLPVTGLSAQTTYTFSVRAYDDHGNLSGAGTKTTTTLTPTDVRVARGPYVQRVDDSSARVIWRTNVAAPSALSYSDGTSSTSVRDPTPRTDHSVLIGPLPSFTRITYTLGYPTPKTGDFQTCAASPATLRLDAVGDMGGGSTPEKDIANLVAADHPDLVAAMGDDVYPTGLDQDFPARLLTPYAAALRGSAYVTTFGNHEYYDPGAAASRRAYSQPGNETFFSFDCSGVHVAVVDAYQPYGPGTAQYQWLAGDLATTTQPWKIVVLHVPPYSSSVAGAAPGSSGVLDPLYERYGVRLVLAGHSHNYERTNAINGVTYVVDGGGGNGLNSFSGTPPSWSAYRAAEYSYVRFTITPDQLVGTEVRRDGTTGDTFTIAGPVATLPDTVIDSAPPAQTTSSSATLTFHATQSGATFVCSVDGAVASACTSPISYSGLASGGHIFWVQATTASGTDPTPAAVGWMIASGAPPPVFTDGFESGDLSAWTSSGGLTVQSALTSSGSFAALANTTVGNTYAKKTLASTYADGYSRVFFNLRSTASQVNLLRHRTAADASLAYVFLSSSGVLGVRNDVTATTITSGTGVAPGSGWHEVELHTFVNGAASTLEVWLDGVRVDALSSTAANLGATAMGRMQIGEVQSGRTYNVVYDDASFGTQRLGP